MLSSKPKQKTAKSRTTRNRHSTKVFAKKPRSGPEAAPLGDRLALAAGWLPGRDFPAQPNTSAELALIEGVARTLSRQR